MKESVKEWTFTLPRELPPWELDSRWTPKSSKSNFRGQNLINWRFFYIIEKLLECICLKWACMNHLDFYNTSYGQKKGHESNWQFVATPLWGKCEDETHIPESGNLESSGTPTTSELDCKDQNTSPWGVLYTVRKDVCSTSYGRKKGRESNCQFDSQPQKVGNRLNSGVCKGSAAHCWKTPEESYKFALDLIPIWGLSRELWAPKVPGVQTGTLSRLLLGNPGNKSHLDAGAAEQRREYYMGEGGGFPWV